MTSIQLANALKDMYENGGRGDKVTMIHLFGIQYAEEIKNAGVTPKEILKIAGMQESYQAEINKGIHLSKYVRVK